jgi:hypothetical protein
MSRNNEERTGALDIHSEVSPQISNQIDSDPASKLSFVAPTEFVELPSAGRFYSEGHPLHEQQCLEIKHMTAKEEDILSDKALLKKGLAIDRFLKSIIIDRSINADSLIVGDRNAILVAARINGYGAEYDTKIICPVCFSHGRHEFNLNECHVSTGEDTAGNVERTASGTLIFALPKTQVQVECKMLTGKDEKSMVASSERRRKQKLPATDLTNQLRAIIVAVDGEEDKGYINSFVENIPAADSRYLRSTYQNYIPNVRLKEIYVCGQCEAETEVEVPFTTDFFWPNT